MDSSNRISGKQSLANVFGVFTKEKQAVSTQRIQENTGLSLPSISRILSSMVERQLVINNDQSKGKIGRAQKLYSLNPDYLCVAGVYIDKEHTYISLGDFLGNVIENISIKTKEKGVNLRDRIFQELDEMLIHRKAPISTLKALGICISAMVTEKQGQTYVVAADIADVDSLNLKQTFEDHYHVPVYVERDTNACLISRLMEKDSENFQNVALLSIGVGLGCSVALNRTIFRGANGFAGEVRNMLIENNVHAMSSFANNLRENTNQSLSYLEILYGTKGILQQAYKLYISDRSDLKNALDEMGHFNIEKSEDISLGWLDELAMQGNHECIALFYESVLGWAGIIVNICCCIDPEAIFLGGELGVHTPYLCKQISESLERYLTLPIHLIPLENSRLIQKAANDYSITMLYQSMLNGFLEEETVNEERK